MLTYSHQVFSYLYLVFYDIATFFGFKVLCNQVGANEPLSISLAAGITLFSTAAEYTFSNRVMVVKSQAKKLDRLANSGSFKNSRGTLFAYNENNNITEDKQKNIDSLTCEDDSNEKSKRWCAIF